MTKLKWKREENKLEDNKVSQELIVPDANFNVWRVNVCVSMAKIEFKFC